jgi:hypothetical protein
MTAFAMLPSSAETSVVLPPWEKATEALTTVRNNAHSEINFVFITITFEDAVESFGSGNILLHDGWPGQVAATVSL